jgi:hypothetical protein
LRFSILTAAAFMTALRIKLTKLFMLVTWLIS